VIANLFAEATARALLDALAAGSRERPAMVFGDGRVTFARFRQRVETLARGRSALGMPTTRTPDVRATPSTIR